MIRRIEICMGKLFHSVQSLTTWTQNTGVVCWIIA